MGKFEEIVKEVGKFEEMVKELADNIMGLYEALEYMEKEFSNHAETEGQRKAVLKSMLARAVVDKQIEEMRELLS